MLLVLRIATKPCFSYSYTVSQMSKPNISYTEHKRTIYQPRMFGDRPIDDIYYLEENELGLKLSDKQVSIAFIRPLRTFNMHCKFDHRMANHILNRILGRRYFAGDLSKEWKVRYGVGNLSDEWDYETWASSKEGKQLLELECKWREEDTM